MLKILLLFYPKRMQFSSFNFIGPKSIYSFAVDDWGGGIFLRKKIIHIPINYKHSSVLSRNIFYSRSYEEVIIRSCLSNNWWIPVIIPHFLIKVLYLLINFLRQAGLEGLCGIYLQHKWGKPMAEKKKRRFCTLTLFVRGHWHCYFKVVHR